MTNWFMQVNVWDSGYNSSNSLTLSITVISVNDEPPRLTNTAVRVTYKEGDGPINLLNSTATLTDDDNCLEHQLLSEIRVKVSSFTPGEDVLLDGEDQQIEFGSSRNGSFEFGSALGSGFGDWETGLLESQISLTCDQTLFPDCYNRLLRGLQYNNTASEPSNNNHTIIIEVCESHLNCFPTLIFFTILRLKTEGGIWREWRSSLTLNLSMIMILCYYWMAEMASQTTKLTSLRVKTILVGQSLFYCLII